MKTQLTIAHLTDVHLGPIAGFGPRYWNLKRLLGYANWLRDRRHTHQREVLARIVDDLAAQAPDHIAVTGDLVNIGLPQEHVAALAWVESLGAPHDLSRCFTRGTARVRHRHAAARQDRQRPVRRR